MDYSLIFLINSFLFILFNFSRYHAFLTEDTKHLFLLINFYFNFFSHIIILYPPYFLLCFNILFYLLIQVTNTLGTYSRISTERSHYAERTDFILCFLECIVQHFSPTQIIIHFFLCISFLFDFNRANAKNICCKLYGGFKFRAFSYFYFVYFIVFYIYGFWLMSFKFQKLWLWFE